MMLFALGIAWMFAGLVLWGFDLALVLQRPPAHSRWWRLVRTPLVVFVLLGSWRCSYFVVVDQLGHFRAPTASEMRATFDENPEVFAVILTILDEDALPPPESRGPGSVWWIPDLDPEDERLMNKALSSIDCRSTRIDPGSLYPVVLRKRHDYRSYRFQFHGEDRPREFREFLPHGSCSDDVIELGRGWAVQRLLD